MRMKNWSLVPDGLLTPTRTGRLTVGRNVTLTSTSKIIKMKVFDTLDKTKLDSENITGLNLEAVMCMTVQVSRLSL
jgi:hypothetical protein